MREANRALLLELIRTTHLTSRPDLVRRTGLTRPTVGAIVAELLQANVVQEVGLASNRTGVGRRERILKFNELSAGYLGIQLDVHATRVAVADAGGHIHHIEVAPSVFGSPKRTVAHLKGLARQALLETPIRHAGVRAIGVTLPGSVRKDSGACALSPHSGWRGFALKTELRKQFRLPVFLSNVAQAGAIAEGKMGTAQGKRSYVWVYLGDTVSAGIMDGGQLSWGMHGLSGEIGHCRVATKGRPCRCGRRDCLESIASAPAILDFVAACDDEVTRQPWRPPTRAGAISQQQRLSKLVDAAHRGDQTARRAFSRAGDHLGIGLSYLANLLNPEVVVLGGQVATAGHLLVEPARKSLQERSLASNAVDILSSKLGQNASLMGAVLLAMDQPPEPRLGLR